MRYSGHPPIHPSSVSKLQSQIAEAHAELKQGINADWRASVLRYPTVLDYFYSLVEMRLPEDDDPAVVNPPFAAAGYADRGYAATQYALKPKQAKPSPPIHMTPDAKAEDSVAITGESRA